MTIDEAVGRILRNHVPLLLVLLVLPLAVLSVVHRPGPEYVASVRLQVPGGPAASNIEADAMSTRVTALATTPRFVLTALADAGARRRWRIFTEKHISVERLGQSPVVRLDVTDRDRLVATQVARSLGTQVVDFMNSSDHSGLPGILAELNGNRERLRERRAALTSLIAQAPSDPRAPTWQAQLSAVEQELADISAERSRVVVDDAAQPRAVIVDRGPRAAPVKSTFLQEAALALVLGMLLGLISASCLELLRPTVPSSRALARLLQLPLLGRVRSPRARHRELEVVGQAVARAARRLDLTTVVLASIPLEDQRTARDMAKVLAATRLPYGSGSPHWRTLRAVAPGEEAGAGLVLLAPDSVKRRDVDALDDVLLTTGWPMLGIVGLPRRRKVASTVAHGLRVWPRLLPRRRHRSHGRQPTGSTPAPDTEPSSRQSLLERGKADTRPRTTSESSAGRCATAGLQVDIESELPWVSAMLQEAAAGDLFALEPGRSPADLHLVVENDRDRYDTTGWQVITRGVHADNGRVVMDDASSTGFSVLVEPVGSTLEVRARWCPSPRARLAAALLPSRFHLLVRCALLQYPALWWSGVRGGVPLHASAVRLGEPCEGMAVLLAGPGGVGKSTLLETELAAGGQATCDNVCVTKACDAGSGVVVSGLLEPLRLEGAAGRRMPHGRREQPWTERASELAINQLVVVRRGKDPEPLVRQIPPDEAARALLGGTYAAGELRRYWPYAASLALGTGLGPVHPPISEVARAVADLLPCTELVLPSWSGIRLADVLAAAGSTR